MVLILMNLVTISSVTFHTKYYLHVDKVDLAN